LLQDIIDFLTSNNIRFKPVNEGDTHVQANCPLCTDTRQRMGILIEPSTLNSDDHKYKCFNCSSKGLSLNSLKKAYSKLGNNVIDVNKHSKITKVDIPQTLADKCHELLFTKQEALDYLLKERRISEEAVKYFKLGYRSKFVGNNGQAYVAGPHISIPGFVGENLVYMKYRALGDVDKGNKWRREKNCQTILFNNEVLGDNEYDEILITEAELDCVALWDAGFKNSVGLTSGAGTLNAVVEAAEYFKRFKKIYLVLDNDEAGQEGAKRIAQLLGLGRCYNVLLPEGIKDASDYFNVDENEKINRIDIFSKILKNAKQFNVEDVKSIHQLTNERLKELEKDIVSSGGYETGYKSLDSILGPIRPGNLIVIAARPKVGKTTLILNILLKMAMKYKVSAFNYQCEMEEEDLLQAYTKMVNHWAPFFKPIPVRRNELGEPLFKDQYEKLDYDLYKKEQTTMLRNNYAHLHLKYLYSFHPKAMSDLDLDKICEKIKEVVDRYKCKFVVFDNLLFLGRGKDVRELVDTATQRFKLLARELNVVFFLITHPRKTNHNKELDNEDLKESGAIFQDADAVILLHREYLDDDDIEEDSDDLISPIMQVKVTARRSKGGRTKLLHCGGQYRIIDNPRLIKDIEFKQGVDK
jgi:replicative DNA helicase